MEGDRDGGATSSTPWACGCLLVSLVFLLVGGLFFTTSWGTLARVNDARSWEAVPCVIEDIGMEDLGTSTLEGRKTKTSYRIKVRFFYEVQGRTYRSERYEFGPDGTYDRLALEETIERLPAGSRTTCWFDPDDPGAAVLSRSSTRSYWHLLLATLLILLAAAGLIVSILWLRSEKH